MAATQKLMRGEETQLSWGLESAAAWGTAVARTQWVGECLDGAHTPDENFGVNKDPIRYVGAAGNRNVDKWAKTNTEFTGTLTFNVQKPFLFWLGMGTVASTGSPTTPITHTIDEIAGSFMPSFTLEDWQGNLSTKNIKRIYEGCTVDSMSLRCSEGEKVEAEISYIAETASMESGAKTSVTAMSGNVFRWEHGLLHISGTGQDQDLASLKEWNWNVNQNHDTPRYQKNTGDISQPIPNDRDYEFTFTVNAPAGSAYDWYDKFQVGGSAFELDMYLFRTSGTDDVRINMSGCHAIDIDQPIKSKGTEEQSWTVRPTKCQIVVRDSVAVDGSDKYLGS